MKITEILDEAEDPMSYLGDIGKPRSPVQDPAAFPGLPGGASRGSSGSFKPRLTTKQAKELGIIKQGPPAVWSKELPSGERIPVKPPQATTATQQQAQQFLQGQGFKKEPTPQQKLDTAAQLQAKTTGEPVITLKPGGLASRMLDKFFPDPKVKVDPIFKEPAEPPMRAVEPQTGMEKNIEYWQKAMPTNTIGGKITDRLMGKKSVDEARDEIDHNEYLQNPNVRKMLDLIGKAEGAEYDTIVGGKKKIDDFSKHPNIVGLRTKQGPSTAAGKYQITNTTFKQYADKLGIRDFSPESQDKIAVQILHDLGALKDVAQGKFKTAINKAGNTWVSLPSSKISQGRGPKSWDWVAKNLQDRGTDVLSAVVGAKSAQADDFVPGTNIRKYSKKDQLPPAPTKAELDIINQKLNTPQQPQQIPNMPGIDPRNISASQAKKLPPVDLFGHILPSIDWNKQGGIGGISIKPYKLPDGTVITNKNEIDKIRSLQKTPGTRSISGPVGPVIKPEVPSEVPKDTTPTINTQKSSIRQEFEKEFAKQRAAQGAGGQFDWTNPSTGKTSKYTTDYAVEPKSKVAESINNELTEILRLSGKI